MKPSTFLSAALLFAAGLTSVAAAAPAVSKPNIIFILADDLGIGGVSGYGADNFKTPNIDKLAESGIRFEHCYSSPLCGPSRALLMTGRYAFRTGMTSNQTGDLLKPANETMMPSVLKQAGYVTAQVGKWAQLPLEPADWGFDEYLRFQGSGKYWNTQPKCKSYTVNGKETPLLDGEYLPDKMHDFAVDFIMRHKDQPFFLYYPMSHVHAQILPTPDSKPGTRDKNILYQDNIAYMDKLVGKLIAELEKQHLREKTLIVYFGDNGTATGHAETSTVGGRRLLGAKGSMFEGGSRVPFVVNWPGITPAGKVSDEVIDSSDFFPTFAALTGAKLPENKIIDGHSFLPQIRGEKGTPREWVFVELARNWYVADQKWKLTEKSELFDLSGAPWAEKLVPADTKDPAAIAARKKLQAALDQLNPAGGFLDDGDGTGRHIGREENRAKKKKSD